MKTIISRRRARAVWIRSWLAAASIFCWSCTALPPPQEWFSTDETDDDRTVVRPSASEEGRTSPAAKIKRLTWDEALRIAGANSPTVVIAFERIVRSEARVREAKSLAYPTLSLRTNYVRFVEAASFRGRSSSNVAGIDTRSRFFTGRGSDVYSAGVDLN